MTAYIYRYPLFCVSDKRAWESDNYAMSSANSKIFVTGENWLARVAWAAEAQRQR